MFHLYILLAKDQGETKEEPRNEQRTPKQKKVHLLRLPSLFPLLYLAEFYREHSERRPRELRLNSPPTKSAICYDCFPKNVDSIPKKVD